MNLEELFTIHPHDIITYLAKEIAGKISTHIRNFDTKIVSRNHIFKCLLAALTMIVSSIVSDLLPTVWTSQIEHHSLQRLINEYP